MSVPFEIETVPEIYDPEEVADFLQRMQTDGLPAFVIHSTDLSDVLSSITENGFDVRSDAAYLSIIGPHTERRKDDWQYPHISIAYDKPMHVDTLPTDNILDHIYIHNTSRGGHNAHFFVPTDEWLANRTKKLPEGTQELFEAGQVDPNVLIPIDHLAPVKKDSTVIFRHQGRRPLAHYFQSTEFPRRSSTHLGKVKRNK